MFAPDINFDIYSVEFDNYSYFMDSREDFLSTNINNLVV